MTDRFGWFGLRNGRLFGRPHVMEAKVKMGMQEATRDAADGGFESNG